MEMDPLNLKLVVKDNPILLCGQEAFIVKNVLVFVEHSGFLSQLRLFYYCFFIILYINYSILV